MAILSYPNIILSLEQIGPKWDNDYKKFYIYENSNVLSKIKFIRIIFPEFVARHMSYSSHHCD